MFVYVIDVDDSNEERNKRDPELNHTKQVGQFGVCCTIRVSVGICENFIIIRAAEVKCVYGYTIKLDSYLYIRLRG